MLSIFPHADRIRMHCTLAYVNVTPTKTGAWFTWEGASEYDPMSGTGSVKLGKDSRLHGRIKIKDGDRGPFIAERASEPAESSLLLPFGGQALSDLVCAQPQSVRGPQGRRHIPRAINTC
jgi:hypothetical protein